ncbi:MAG: hypothetical protein JWM31_2839 [Solirubrobacterales bacterium]|nr:hypothetical protein [Solirubrobacterales bacterium]
MLAIELTALLAQAGGSGGINGGLIAAILVVIGTVGGGGGLVALFLANRQGKQLDATTEKIQADAASVLTQANESFARMQRDQATDVENALQRMRDEVRDSRAQAAEAAAATAIAEAKAARLLAEESDRRHALINDHAAERAGWATERIQLRHELDNLRKEVASLRAQLDARGQGRRSTDRTDNDA